MKTKENFTSNINLKPFMVLTLIAIALMTFPSCMKNKTSELPGKVDGAYQKVDEVPVFPGGDSLLLNYITKNTTYPKEAKEKGIQGRVIVKFMVKEDGKVSDVSVVKSDNPILDSESVRVVSTLPNFAPGKLKGQTVPVWFMVPITYRLN